MVSVKCFAGPAGYQTSQPDLTIGYKVSYKTGYFSNKCFLYLYFVFYSE